MLQFNWHGPANTRCFSVQIRKQFFTHFTPTCYTNLLEHSWNKHTSTIRLLALVLSAWTVPYVAIDVSTVLTPYTSVATCPSDVTGKDVTSNVRAQDSTFPFVCVTWRTRQSNFLSAWHLSTVTSKRRVFYITGTNIKLHFDSVWIRKTN